MDPASAVITFVGFSAAVAQLAGTVANGCKALHNLKQKLDETPRDIVRLDKSLKRLKRIIVEIRSLEKDIGEHWSSSDLATHWSDHAVDIETDVSALDHLLSKLARSLESRSITSKHVRSTIRAFLMEDDLAKFERLLAAHQDTFSFMLNIVAEKRSRRMLSEIQTQTKRIDEINTRATLPANAIIVRTQRTRSRPNGLELVLRDLISEEMESLSPSSTEDNYTKELLSSQVAVGKELCLLPLESNNNRSLRKNSDPSGLQPQTPPPIANKEKTSIVTRYMVTCKIFSRQFPIGVLTGREITKSRLGACSSHDTESDWQLTATLFPLPWLANRIIQVAVGYSFAEGYNFRYRGYQYNPDPRLIECLNTGNLEGLQRMFTDGKAGVHDLVAPWGNSLLHEAVLRHATGVPNMLDICNFLLIQGIDPNLQNSNGRTALIQCCQLMKKSELLNKALIPLASCMIERGADLSLTNREGYSVCALLFESPQGFSYIDEYVYQHIDLCTYENLRSTDFWLVAALARCLPPFRRRLEAQLEAFRTPKTISSSARPLQDTITGVSIDEQVRWIRAASQKDRTVFMRTICAHGSLSMVEPFLTCGLDLDETFLEQSVSYIRAAGRSGNLKVVRALLGAGASVDQGVLASTHQLATSLVDDLIIRWRQMKAGRPPYATEKTSPVAEYKILPSILLNPTFQGPNVLLTALHSPSDPEVMAKMLECGCGRRDGQPPASWHINFVGSEVIEAVKLQSPYLKQMLENGLGIECEDRLGCTAALHALDMGSAECLRLLIEHGVNLTRTTKYGISALQFAESNLRASHPRSMQRAWVNKFEWQHRYSRQISLEADQRTYEMVEQAIFGGKRGILPLLLYHNRSDPRPEADTEVQGGEELRLVFLAAILTGAMFILSILGNGMQTIFKLLGALPPKGSRK